MSALDCCYAMRSARQQLAAHCFQTSSTQEDLKHCKHQAATLLLCHRADLVQPAVTTIAGHPCTSHSALLSKTLP